MGTKTLLTLDQFFAMPEDESGCKYELDHGELITFPPQPLKHELTKNMIADLLRPSVQGRGRVLVETGVIVDPESWRIPDVCVVWNEQLAGANRNEPFGRTPDLCIEVHSPSDSKRTLKRKVKHLLETGAKIVWVVYTDSREVQVVSLSGEKWFGPDEEIDCPELLPAFRVRVKSLFE